MKIKIIGLRDLIEIDRKTASKIKKIWVDMKMGKGKSKDDMVEIGNWTGTYGRIDYIDLTDRGGNVKYNDEVEQNAHTDYMNYRKRMLNKTSFQRAQNINIFKLVYQAFTDELMPPEELQKQAIEIQTKFFEKNPKRIYCDPLLFKHFFKGKKATESLMRLVVNCIQTDMEYAYKTHPLK